jgi:spermidine synthase
MHAGARRAASLHLFVHFTLMKIQRWLVYVAIFLSGFAGLGYEMVCTRMLALTLGHEITAVLAVLASFFSGLALGAWFLDGRISASPRPALWYALCEGIIGLWALLLALLFPEANRIMHIFTGIVSSPLQLEFLCFVLPFFLLLPATFAMGATLPAIDRLFATLRSHGRRVAGLYSANTFGAVAGTMLTTFLLAPWLGSRASLIALAAVNFACAAAVWLLPMETIPRDSSSGKTRLGRMDGRLAAVLLFTGFLGIGFEVVAVRTLSQVLENTVYSFANVLSVYLLGTAIGAALYQRWRSDRDFNEFLNYVLSALSACCLLSMLLLSRVEYLYSLIRYLFGGGFGGSLAAEACAALAVVSLPTLIMGATFAHLAQAARRHDGGVGQALCVNTVGASLAPILLGSVVLSMLGSKSTMLLVSLGYLALIPIYERLRIQLVTASAILTLVVLYPGIQLQLITLRPGDLVVKNVEGVMASVTVVRDARDDIHLKVNNHFQMGGTSSYYSDRRQGHIPLLLHPDPKTALYLGLGTGATFAAAGAHPGLQADGVERVLELPEPMIPGNCCKPRGPHCWPLYERAPIFLQRMIRCSPSPRVCLLSNRLPPGICWSNWNRRILCEKRRSGCGNGSFPERGERSGLV